MRKNVSGLVIAAVVLSVVITSVGVTNMGTQTEDPKIPPGEEKEEQPPGKEDPNKPDKTPPVIIIDHLEGDGTDENPGYWQVSAYDDESGINHDTIEISIDGELCGTTFGDYDVPCTLGDHTIEVKCENDHKDPLEGTSSDTISIADDDVDPPELSNLVIDVNFEFVTISLTAIDYSGINEFIIKINDEVITPINMEENGNDYVFILENQWLFECSTVNVEVEAYDADNDREDDALSASIYGSFTVSIGDMYQFVIHQIEELKDYINSHIESKRTKCLIRKLTKAQDALECALHCFEEGEITSCLCLNVIARGLLWITEKKLVKSNKIPEDEVEFIINELHIIRNNLIILMEASLGIDYGIASIKITLLELLDYMEDNLDHRPNRCLRYLIKSASLKLDCALIFLSMEKDPSHILGCSQSKLQRAVYKIEKLMDKGVVSQEIGDNIKDILLQSIEDIDTVITLLA